MTTKKWRGGGGGVHSLLFHRARITEKGARGKPSSERNGAWARKAWGGGKVIGGGLSPKTKVDINGSNNKKRGGNRETGGELRSDGERQKYRTDQSNQPIDREEMGVKATNRRV